jgi:geranylgeranyl diphosphate synthase type I
MASESYSSIFGPILADLDAEMQAIRRERVEKAPILWDIIDYHFGWNLPPYEAERFKNVAGKKIRPLLMTLVARAITGDYRPVLPAGAALEMIHNFTLIHDDVMDKSLERRHRPAIWTRWGSSQAINAGDGIYALANLAVARLLNTGIPPAKVVRVFQLLSNACLATAEGQILDIDFETRRTVTTDDYIMMISHKSAALISCAAQIGALLSTDDSHLVEEYAQFAWNLGIAFQVRDDYLGVWGDEAQTGKSATSDIREKKKSYPVLVAFECGTGTDRAELERLYAQNTLSHGDVQAVMTILDRVKAAEQTDQIAGHYYDLAMKYLAETNIQNETQDLIRRYAQFLVRRVY